VALPIIESVIQGYNGAVIAYGQTATGKTYSFEGEIGNDDLEGIIPRSCEMMFNFIRATPNTHYLVKASFFDIYNENVRDLLSSNNKK
jgi:hypothetical protein